MSPRPGGRPDPAAEIRLVALAAARGANYWSRRPVVRLDLVVGAYDELSSAEVPGVPERLERAMPGLVEHRCSVGARGGFLARLRRGTYAPHVLEHVALELQAMIGHDVGYGRARGGDAPGAYTVVVEHRHEAVGLQAAARALDVVRRAFAGTLEGVEREVAELRAAAATPDAPPLAPWVLAGVTGGALRAETRDLLRARLAALDPPRADAPIVELPPGDLLRTGLPYARSELAVVLDAAPRDVPPRYREPDRAERLVGVVADGVRPGGLLVAPAGAREVRAYAREVGCRVAVFDADGRPPRGGAPADVVAWAAGGRVWREDAAGVTDLGPLRAGVPAAAQLAALLAAEGVRDAAGAAARPEPAGAAG